MKAYKITLTEEQMRIIEKCTEFYIRAMMGQESFVAEEIAFDGVDISHDNPNHEKIFDRTLQRRDDLQEVLRAAFAIAHPFYERKEKSETCQNAQCIWDAVRFARGMSNWSSPFQIGTEPLPKIEVIEEDTAEK